MFLAMFGAPQQGAIVVERARVGPVSIGATAEEIYQEFGDRVTLVDLKQEGLLSPALAIKLYGSQFVPSIIAEIAPAKNTFVVHRIHVMDPSLRTKDDIGVGSTYEELRSRYSVDSVGLGEGSFFARVEALAISFVLDSSKLPSISIRNPAEVPKGVRVISMMLNR
jgi:hypothetical protein